MYQKRSLYFDEPHQIPALDAVMIVFQFLRKPVGAAVIDAKRFEDKTVRAEQEAVICWMANRRRRCFERSDAAGFNKKGYVRSRIIPRYVFIRSSQRPISPWHPVPFGFSRTSSMSPSGSGVSPSSGAVSFFTPVCIAIFAKLSVSVISVSF